MEKKLFTEKQIDIAAILAGPIPPGFLIYKNYIALGKEKQAYIALASTLIFTVAFFYGIFQVPHSIIDKIPNFVFTAFYGLLVFIFFRNFMAKDVNDAFEAGAKKGSNWAVTGITILGLALNVGIIFGLAMDQPIYDGEVMIVEGNKLYYDAELVPIEDVNKLAKQFKTNDFFGADYGNTARLQFIDDEYFITMLVDQQFWKDSELISNLTSMKWLLEIEFGKPTKLILESVSLSGTSRYKEL
ncbi:MAG: hypothetical protein RIG68_17060 [Imperialibacter sp.]|uniref:hypothetical protein n=1 Tax=Imperialibacter sp. TaxID=2038411 RepID=UPI0032EFD6DA